MVVKRTQLTFRGDVAKAAFAAGSVRGVNMAIERLRGDSVELAPVDQGDLRGSAATIHADEQQARPTASLVFDVPYAAKQHEDASLNHTAGANGEPAGEDHYVSKNYENPQKRETYRNLIGRGVSDEFNRR